MSIFKDINIEIWHGQLQVVHKRWRNQYMNIVLQTEQYLHKAVFHINSSQKLVKEKKTCTALHGISQLRSITRHMGSHSVTCHPTQVSAPSLNPSHAGRYSIHLPQRDGRLSWPCYSETQPPGVELATPRSRIQCPNHWATKQLVRGYSVSPA